MARQQRSEHTRRQLVRAAAELFDRDGFVRATMADISLAAGVTKGALYFHFPSKETLAAAVRAEAIEMLETLVARLAATRTEPMRSVVELYDQVVRWMREDTMVRACLRISDDTGETAGFCASWLDATEWLLKGELAEAESAATVLVGLCLGVETLRRNGIPREDLADLWNLVLPALTTS